MSHWLSAVLPPLILSAAVAAPALAQQAAAAARVDSLFATWDRADSPGAAVAVLRHGEVVLERGYGSAQLEHEVPITPATVFHVASVTKQFTAFGAALLAHRGVLSLEDDIQTHLPELADFGAPITIRHLIHHTSGIRDQWELLAIGGWRLDDVITKDQILRMLARQRELNFEPGSEYLYSNSGYTLLAEIIERASGTPFPQWMAENVFRPVGMSSTHLHDDHRHLVPGRAYSYAPADDGWGNAVLSYANAGATSLFTTAGDLARWLHNLETAAVGGRTLVERIYERGVLIDGDTLDYAFALSRGEHRGRATWSHGGADAGFRSFVLHMPAEQLGVVVLSNLSTMNTARLARDVADIYLGVGIVAVSETGSGAAPASEPLRVAPRSLEAYVGRYDVPQIGIVRIELDGNRLLLWAEGARFALTPESESVFAVEKRSERIEFVRDGEGVTALAVHGNAGALRGMRLAAPALARAQLEQFAGSYYSPEVETIYTVAVEGDSLIVTHQRHPPFDLTPLDDDVFAGGRWYFQKAVFTRDAVGAIDGFDLTGGRVRNLRFVRLDAARLPSWP